MMMWNLAKFLLLFTSVTYSSAAKCSEQAKVCEFWLEIDMALTMMYKKNAVYPADGKLYLWNDTNKLSPIDSDNVITADGWETPRLVIVANSTMPGPSIEVYEGQQVLVHVKNKLSSESTSIHWHGLYQKGTPWMDGVGYVSHCPIGPGQTFTYKFMAHPVGSFIYHAHIGVQRTMGLYGPLIVRKNVTEVLYEEFFAIISDWNHDWDSNVAYLKMINGIFTDRVPYIPTASVDGANFSRFRFDAGLINGKGRFYYNSSTHNGAPLEVFPVSKGYRYRFRWANAGNMYPFRIEIDQHDITIVSSDGYEVKPVIGKSFIINPGERFDFILSANQNVDNYWIRAYTLENLVVHQTAAILRYDGAREVDPNSGYNCTNSSRCRVLNCPFKYFPKYYYSDCVTFDKFKSVEEASIGDDTEEPIEIFLNFAFPGTPGNTPGSVNGRAFKVPTSSAQTQPKDLGEFVCKEDDCGEQELCECMHSVNLENNKLYQIVLTNMGIGKGFAHPVHMHGHGFYVVKMGYSTYNNETGQILEENMDVDCGGGVARPKSYCNNAAWAKKVSELELKNPPQKDNIIVPTGGYVVLRIRADNPGVWFMHCHIELHNHNGMALVLNESFPKHPKPPRGFPTCGNYVLNSDINGVVKQVQVGKTFLWMVVLVYFITNLY